MEPEQTTSVGESVTDGVDATNQESQFISVVNVKETKKPPTSKREDDNLWYNSVKYWFAISLIPSLISMLIAIRYIHFAFLSIAFPLIAVAAFYMRKLFRDKNLDQEEWLK